MTVIRLYLDENRSDRRLADALRAAGVDVVAALDMGMRGCEDEEHLIRATELGGVVFTEDAKDYYRIHGDFLRSGRNHGGIIIVRQGLSRGEQLRRILHLAAERKAEEMKDSIEFLSDW